MTSFSDADLERATRAIHDVDCPDGPDCAELTTDGRYGRYARAVLDALAASGCDKELVDWLGRFTAALGSQKNYYESPLIGHDDPIFVIRTRPGFIFDDNFWGVFQSFPFRVCHVAYYGPARTQDDGLSAPAHPGVFELRWALRTNNREDEPCDS